MTEGVRHRRRYTIVLAAGLIATGLAARCAAGRISPSGDQVPAASASLAAAPTEIGINLGEQEYWSTQWVFADPIMSTGQLYFIDHGDEGGGPFIDQLRHLTNGRPLGAPAGTRFHVGVQQGVLRAPSGVFDCTISPGWEVTSFGTGTVSQHGTRFRYVIPNVPDPFVQLRLRATKDGASLSELACAPAGAPGTLFNPDFLADNRPFRVLRFLHWMRANDAPKQLWAERATPASFSQAGPKGMALEYMVQLCTDLPCDPWFTLPLDTDADYYRAFATYVRDHLPRDRKIYVELSNEVWNEGFGQGREATKRGRALYPDASPLEANDYYYADRVREFMAVWTQVFAGQEKRLVRVAAAQAVYAQRARNILSHEETWRSVDALAVAPYFGRNIQEVETPGAARIDAMFASVPKLIDDALRGASENKAVAARYGLRFMAYEGGQHFVAFTPEAKADLAKLEHDPRMYDAYKAYIGRWNSEIGGLLMLFDSVSNTSFGMKDYTGQPLSEAPKMRAAIDFIKAKEPPR